MNAIAFPVRRWAFVMPSPLGDTNASFELRDDALVYASDDVFESSATIAWDRIVAGGTASMAGMGGPGAPDMPAWTPARMEWLLLSVADADGFMRRLPPGPETTALVDALRARLGPRWIGDGLPLADTQRRLGIVSKAYTRLDLVGLVLGVFAMLIAALFVLVLLLTPFVVVPAGLVAGAWLLRRGLADLRLGRASRATPPSRVAEAIATAPGPVRLEGRAATDRPTIAPISGRSSVWWDVTVSLEYREDQTDVWRQVASRHDGTIDIVDVEDPSGRVPVWLPGARLVLAHDSWTSGIDALPPAALAFLDELGFAWDGRQTLRVAEERMEVGAPLTVFGHVDRRRDIPASSPADLGTRAYRAIVSGRWRRALVGALPSPLRAPAAVTIGYLDFIGRLGWGRDRPMRIDALDASEETPPPLPPDAIVVWRGSKGAPFLASNRSIDDAMTLFRQRALLTIAAGGAVVGFAIYTFVTAVRG